MTFKFDKGIPNHQLRFLEAPPTNCDSDLPAQVAGAIWLEITFRPAAAHDDTGSPTVAETSIPANLPAVLAAAQTCDLEGTVTWALGLPQVLGVSSSSSIPDSTFVLAVSHP